MIKKQSKLGVKFYRYYRCSDYNAPGYPRTRLQEKALDEQMLGLFDTLKIEDEKVRHSFARVLREKIKSNQEANRERIAELNRQLTMLRRQQDQLLNLQLLEEIDQDTFAAKGTELRDRIAHLAIDVDLCDWGRAESAEIAIAAFELSQTLMEKMAYGRLSCETEDR